jgi:hypothetical protein
LGLIIGSKSSCNCNVLALLGLLTSMDCFADFFFFIFVCWSWTTLYWAENIKLYEEWVIEGS